MELLKTTKNVRVPPGTLQNNPCKLSVYRGYFLLVLTEFIFENDSIDLKEQKINFHTNIKA